ncbi:hypothetical protein V8F06_008678 [Rhypophila decipiens]
MHRTRSSFWQTTTANMPRMLGLILSLVLTFAIPATGLYFTNSDWQVEPGEDFHLAWKGMERWVNITLLIWSNQELDSVDLLVIANNLDTLEFQWKVPNWLDTPILLNRSSPVNENGSYYYLRIQESGIINFSSMLGLKMEDKSAISDNSTDVGINGTDVGIGSGYDELDNGEKAGIGAGAAVAALGMMVLVGYFFYRRGRKVEASRNGWTKYSKGGASSKDDLEAASARPTAVSLTPEELHADEMPTPELEVVETPIELGVATVWEMPTGEKCMEEMEQMGRSDEELKGNDVTEKKVEEIITATDYEKDQKGTKERSSVNT